MKQEFYTKFKKDHKFFGNEYVLGVVYGLKLALCGDGRPVPRNGWDRVPVFLSAFCEPEQYEAFREAVENHYPGMCEFDYKS